MRTTAPETLFWLVADSRNPVVVVVVALRRPGCGRVGNFR